MDYSNIDGKNGVKKNIFSMEELPIAYFCDNKNSDDLRNQLIKNQVKISECNQTDLENYFFSDENIDNINKQLVLKVYNHTKGLIKISKQSKDSLIIVMRYVFLEYAKHLPYNIKNQILELNCIVVGEVLPNVLTNANQKIDYLNEINNPRKLLPLPISTKKVNTLPSVTGNFKN
jgi:adenylyl- and sulfurtransferase ThiI